MRKIVFSNKQLVLIQNFISDFYTYHYDIPNVKMTYYTAAFGLLLV